MESKFISRRLFCAALCSLFVAVSSYGDTPEEIFFAEQLRRLGYEHLAEDHLIRTRNRAFLPEHVRIEAVRRLASLYRDEGRRAERDRDFEAKRRNFDRAIREYSRFLAEAGDRIDRVDRYGLWFEKGEIAYDMAMDSAESMRATVEEDEKEDYKQDALRWFSRAVEALEQANDFFVELRDALEPTLDTDEERMFFHRIQRRSGAASMALGNAIFEHARLFDDASRQQTAYTRAISIFENVAEKFPLYAIRYQAYRQIGQCYRYLENFTKAIEYFDLALSVRESPATRWDRRIARLYQAQTYNEWAQYDPERYQRAIVASDALITDVEREAEVRRDRDTIDMVFAAWIEKGRAMIGSSLQLIEASDQAFDRGENILGEQRLREARARFRTAVAQVNEIAENPDSRWARNARGYVDEWVELSARVFDRPIDIPPGITTYMAQGMRRFEEGSYWESILSFMQAVEVGDPYVYGDSLIPEALYHMGLAYYYLSSPERTGGKFNYYYEAALCFQQIALNHSGAEFAPDAAFYGQQFFGALFEHTRQLVDMGRLEETDLQFDGERYYMALESFRQNFPGDPRAGDLQFQAAEVARAIGNFEEASGMYARVMQEHHRYYEAQFRAGYSLYLAALNLYEEHEDDPPLERIGELLERAARRYSEYVRWFENNRGLLDPQELEVVNRWIVRTKVTWGRLLIHDVWVSTHDAREGAERALSVLEGIEQQHMSGPGMDGLRAEFLPDAYFITIQAYRRMERLEEANRFVDGLAEQYGEHELSSRAAGLLGYAYLQRRRSLEEENGDNVDIEIAARQAGRYLSLALELDPEQSLDVYNDTAAQLYIMEEYGEAVGILEAGLSRFPVESGLPPDEVQMRAVEIICMAYREKGNWRMVAETAQRLMDYEDRINSATGARQENIDFRRDYAMAMEELGNWSDAAAYWRQVKSLAGRMDTLEGLELDFEATVSLARCHAEQGDRDRGHRVLAWYLISSDRWLLQPEWGAQVRRVYEEYFGTEELNQLQELVFQLVESDLNLLRRPASREQIVGMVRSYWPERDEDLQRYLKQVEAEI